MLRYGVTAVCAGSAGVHAALIRPHLVEGGPPLGAAFAAAAAALALGALAVRQPRHDSCAPTAVSGVLFLIALSYLLSRTIGIPLLIRRSIMRRPLVRVMLLSVTASVLFAAIATGQSAASAEPAQALIRLMTTRQLDAFAAADPMQPGRFAAVLLIPGAQLLVVTATSPSADAIQQRMASGAYREVYLDLQGTPTRAGKVFVQDAGADGIHDGQNGVVDVAYEDGTRQTVFDRALAKQLKGASYDRALTAADERYAGVLKVLVEALQASPSSSSRAAK